MSIAQAKPPAAISVPEHGRTDFLPTLFGLNLLPIGENTVYSLMQWLSPEDYGGGFWDFYALKGKPLYLAPKSNAHYRIMCRTNDYSGTVTADAAGIMACLMAFSHLSIRYQSERMGEAYIRLFSYVAKHPEASEIYRAID